MTYLYAYLSCLTLACAWRGDTKPLLQVLLALDHFLLALFTLGNCKPYEMISSAAYSLELDGKLMGRLSRPVIDALFYMLQKDHCYKSWRWQKSLYQGAENG